MELETTTAMEQQPPAVKRTYGSRKAAPILEDGAVTSGSELTSLSQLTAGVRSDSSDEPTTYAKAKLPAPDSLEPSSEADDSGYSGKLAGRRSIADMMKDVDEAFDNAADDEVPRLPSLPAREREPSSPALNSSPSVNNDNDKESPRFPASEATQVASDNDEQEDVEESEQLVNTAKAKGLVRRSKKAILDSEDEEEEAEEAGNVTAVEEAVKKPISSHDSDDDEERLPDVKDALKVRKTVTSDSDEEMEVETQETEDIEQYRESQDGKKSTKAKQSKEPKVKKLSKAEQDDMHKTSEAMIRNQYVGIEARSRKARPLSEIAARLKGTEAPSSSAFQNLSSRKPSSFSSTNRRQSVALQFSRATPTSTPSASARPLAAKPRHSAPILIGSSSAIFDIPMDEDSYDPSYLESQSQTQTQDGSQVFDVKPVKQALKATSSIEDVVDGQDEDEELPDLNEMREKEKKAKLLRDKKAALLLQQRIREDNKKQMLASEEPHKYDVKGKGKSRAETPKFDFSSDSDGDLVITVPRAPSPKIEKTAHVSLTQNKLRTLLPKRERAVTEDATTESQFQRAGRTFVSGTARTLVNPHVESQIDRRAKQPKKPSLFNPKSGISKKAQDMHLLAKITAQNRAENERKKSSWESRGGDTLNDKALAAAAAQQANAEDQEQEKGDRAKDLMDRMREGAEKSELQVKNADDGDDEDDEDYVGSDEEQNSGAEAESGDEWGSADENAPAAEEGEDGTDSETEAPSQAPSSPAFHVLSKPATQSTQSGEDKEDVVFRKPSKIKSRPQVLADDEEEASPSHPEKSNAFGAPAFPAYVDPEKMGSISLTQAFGNPEDSQPKQRADRALFSTGGEFAEMFEDDTFGDSQLALTQTQTQVIAPKALPKMFGQAVFKPMQDDIIGNAFIAGDIVAREEDRVDEAARIAYELELKKQVEAEEEAFRRDRLTTTPGSTVSEDLPPVSPLPLTAAPYDLTGSPTTMVESDHSEDDLDMNVDTQATSNASPSKPRRLRRAGDELESSASPQPAPKAPDAFEVMLQAQLRQKKQAEKAAQKKERMKNNEFLAEQAEESEEETPFAALRKAADGDDEEGDDSDLDGSVAELVDDQKVDAEQQTEQDKLALEKHQEQLAADAARHDKRVEKIVAGDYRKRKAAEGDLLDDSDYEDDEMGVMRKARVKKPRKFGKITEALAANESTKAFADVIMDKTSAMTASQEANESQYLVEEPEEDEASGDDEYESEMDESRSRQHQPKPRMRYTSRTPTPDYDEIHSMIWEAKSSPAMELGLDINNRLRAMPKKIARPVIDDFADLDEMYTQSETSMHVRKTVILDKEDSQNDRGLGPGRTSAVTSFVVRKETQGKMSRTASMVSTTKSTASLSRSNSSASTKSTKSVFGAGRLAKARQKA